MLISIDSRNGHLVPVDNRVPVEVPSISGCRRHNIKSPLMVHKFSKLQVQMTLKSRAQTRDHKRLTTIRVRASGSDVQVSAVGRGILTAVGKP